MRHLLSCEALFGVLAQQQGHKVLGFRADAVPRLALEVDFVAENGLPAMQIGTFPSALTDLSHKALQRQ